MTVTRQAQRKNVALRLGLIIAATVFCHYGFWLNIELFGVTAETLMLGSALMGVMLGPVWGASAGFIFGIAHDLVAPTPLGLAALTFTLGAYSMAYLSDLLEARYWWQGCFYGSVGMASFLVFFVSTGELLGQEFLIDEHFPRVLWVNIIYAVFLSPGMWLALRFTVKTPTAKHTHQFIEIS